VPLTPQEAEATMRSRNMPDWLITHLLSVGKTAAKGGFDNESTQPIRDIVGRAPITTRQFAQDFKAAFS